MQGSQPAATLWRNCRGWPPVGCGEHVWWDTVPALQSREFIRPHVRVASSTILLLAPPIIHAHVLKTPVAHLGRPASHVAGSLPSRRFHRFRRFLSVPWKFARCQPSSWAAMATPGLRAGLLVGRRVRAHGDAPAPPQHPPALVRHAPACPYGLCPCALLLSCTSMLLLLLVMMMRVCCAPVAAWHLLSLSFCAACCVRLRCLAFHVAHSPVLCMHCRLICSVDA